MSTRDDLKNRIGQAHALSQRNGRMFQPGYIADVLLVDGWRPPMRVIETVEELEAVQFPAILEGSGTYMDGKSTFQNCQFRPVPEWAGGEPGVFETLIVAGVGAPACAWAKDIQLTVKVLWEPEVKA